MTKPTLSDVHTRTHGTGQGIMDMEGLRVAITILDARRNFGRVDVLVTPVAGSGERWVDLNRVHPLPAAERGREEQGE